jgi:N-acetylmuramoyl-L-alanine amidase
MDPCVFSPSQQPHNQYAGGAEGFADSEQYWMEQLADKCKAAFDRQDWGIPSVVIKEGSVGGQVRKSNELDAGIHVALHTNAGGSTGTLIIHYPGSVKGAALANALFGPIAEASDTPDVGIWAKSYYYETRETHAPAVIIEYQFHDNHRDAAEIRRSLDEYAEATTKGLATYYGKTYTPPATAPVGSVWMAVNMPTDQADELIRQAHSVGAQRVLTLDAPGGSMTVLAHVTRAMLPRLRLYCTNRGRTPVWWGAQDVPDIQDAQ